MDDLTSCIPSVLLIQLYGSMQPPDAEPLSVEVLAAAILNKYPFCHVVTITIKKQEDISQINSEIINTLLSQVIGISVPQSTFDLSFLVIEAIYRTNPDANIILGHALPTHSPDYFLRIFPKLLIVRGWGEESFVQLIEYYCAEIGSIENIPNLCYLKNGRLFFTHIKWPSTIVNPIRYAPELFFPRVEGSRGCHHDVCTFCTRQPRNKKLEPSWRRRKISEIIEDISEIKSKGKYMFTFTDEDFIGDDLVGAQSIAKELQSIKNIHFSISVRIDNIINPLDTETDKKQRRRVFELLRKAGLNLVFLGVESLSNSQLKRYNKHVTSELCIRSIGEIQSLGIGFEMGFILFDPLLTENELSENIQVIEETGLWANIGNIFNYLRPQKDSAYVDLLNKSKLSGIYNPNTLSYDSSFLYDVIGKIFQQGNSWIREFDPIYLLARNIARNEYANGQYLHFVLVYRSLTFRYLRFLSKTNGVLTEVDSQEKLQFFNVERNTLIRNLYQAILRKERNTRLTETELVLKIECSSFLSLHPIK